ncbi:response regulator [Lacihabitans sp. CCS-44]|jgi:CheY-like chemotaxis protein|uniref:response regulator n=1 Tax=Lacihabitans sp. CCS-44 TaxID=2487331 RepID=UPI001B48967A|nr:response regulator [Lacihabitans sp. CCS-44]MBP6618634.1 response regulator [Leadbetterella sp.]MCP9756347.1 response regulator [Lacihabitans sp. CCS-44]
MKRILLIEDNNEIRENTAEILELDGYEVITAENGKIGVELASNSKPDLIICDIMMPVLDGYSVLHLLSKNPETENIPFIFLTAKADRQDFRKGMEMGADDYITKPFDDVDLLNAIESRFKKIELLEKKYSRNIDGLNNLVRDVGGEQELRNLTNNREKRKYKKKSEIFREGDFPLYLFYIEKGKIKTYKTNEEGKELIINLHNEGDFFGYVNLMRENSYMESAAALEDCEITLIPKSEFFKLIHQNRQVSQKFIKMLSDNIKENEDQLLKLAYNSVRKRVSECLIKFFDQNEDKKPNNGLKISREDLSNMAGTSIETAIRTLSDFKDEKLIEISSGKIKILDLEKLRRLKN